MEKNPEREIHHRQLDTGAENPGVEVVLAVSDIEEKRATDLTTMHDCVDGVLDNLFSDPPSAEAQMQVTFSYETYRITVEQDGHAKFVKTE